MADVAVALDVPSEGKALALADRLGVDDAIYKVGLELFTREGPSIVRAVRDRGARVFLDLKLHDIPNTVAASVAAAADQGVDFLTVHATGGTSMLEAAAEAAGGRLTLLAVTVLTSLSETELASTWSRSSLSIPDEVVRLAVRAAEAGIGGAVASVHEAGDLRRRLGPDALLATPGIRFGGGETHDQERVSTPAGAVRAGSDLLVVGRAITRAPDPREAYLRVVDEVRSAAEVTAT